MTYEEQQRKKAESKGVPIYDKMPKGWTVSVGALTAPAGYTWINNKKSLFSKERKSALLKE